MKIIDKKLLNDLEDYDVKEILDKRKADLS